MSSILTELVIILALLLLNGLFAMSEIAVVTARKIRLEQRAEGGDEGARAALALAQDPTQFLSTVQVGITLIGVLAGAFGGASLAEELAAVLARSPRLAPYAEGMGLAIVVAGITYLSLVIGELVPKRIGLGAPERIASLVARPMRVVSRVVSPLVRVLTFSTNLLLRLLRVRGHADAGVTEEEIRALVEQGAESGVVEAAEHQLVERVFRLGDRQVSAMMTPRPDLDWVDLDDDPAALRAALGGGGPRHGLVLACRGEVDAVVGFVHAEDLLVRCLTGRPLDGAALAEAAREPLYVPETTPAFRLLEQFRAQRRHAAVALDEYGGVAGVVTLDDVLQELVGDIPHPGVEPNELFVRRDDGSWLADGQAGIADLEVVLDATLVEEERPGFHTLGGFVMARLGRVPRTGERFDAAGFRFEIVDMDGRRVDRVLIAPAEAGRAAGQAAG